MRNVILINGMVATLLFMSYLKSPNPPIGDTRRGWVFEAHEFNYAPRIIVHATGYCSCPICCGKWSKFNRTANGSIPNANRTIAADTSYIPFNTCLHIPKLGKRIVQDRGSKIKEFAIDIFYSSHLEAKKMFKRNMIVEFCN